uniref:Zonadhesin n=1 Tax=Ciona intestinalis TaxID=7719 RepID=F6PI29_CIOIN|nr:zonadhesin [Ciona intestinalis]|eukprot:XP_002125197.1 zonadhesin [Ciona intestinalis]
MNTATINCVLLCCLVGGAYSLVGEIPTQQSCYLESFRRVFSHTIWYPHCYGAYYNVQQCDLLGRCWCVRMQSGRSISDVYHAHGTVDCFRTQSTCRGKMMFYQCPTCNVTCADVGNPPSCSPTSCIPRCQCPPGFYLKNDQCVTADQCRPACPGNQLYSTCAGCEQTCHQRNVNTPCTLQCRQGCACPSGTYLHGDQCLTDAQCSVALACPHNQIYSLCAGCSQTCAGRNTPTICTLQCRQQCTCPTGTYLHNGQCLTNAQCDAALACPSNQVYSLCAGCDMTCSQRGQLIGCATICRQKCTCPPGMYLEGDTCVTGEQCSASQACNASLNEEFMVCAASCDATCDEPQRSCSTIKTCRQRCACPINHVRDANNVCVNADACTTGDQGAQTACQQQQTSPQPLECDTEGNFVTQQCNNGVCFCVDSQTGSELTGTRKPTSMFDLDCQFLSACPADSAFASCATECPPTCSNPNPRCTRRCAVDCVCNSGMIKASATNRTCVPMSDCPATPSCRIARAMLPGNPVFPQCNADGTYVPTQCDANDNCYCVYENGTRITGSEGVSSLLSALNHRACIEARTCAATPGMTFLPCAPPCDATCGEPRRLCSLLESCTARCGCMAGYLLAPDNRTCVPANTCPSSQPVCNFELGEIFSTCAPSCDATCFDLRRPCSLTKICRQRCTCPEGHVRDALNACVPVSSCAPPLPPSCDNALDEVWSDCATECDATCALPRKPCSLIRSCTERCACPNGKIRNSENRCVTSEQCTQRALNSRTACQQQYDEMSSPLIMDAFIPDCDNVTGLYMLKQCYGFGQSSCWCVNPETGVELPNTRVPGYRDLLDLNCSTALTEARRLAIAPLEAQSPPPPPADPVTPTAPETTIPPHPPLP